jgi:hypothetical protein
MSITTTETTETTDTTVSPVDAVDTTSKKKRKLTATDAFLLFLLFLVIILSIVAFVRSLYSPKASPSRGATGATSPTGPMSRPISSPMPPAMLPPTGPPLPSAPSAPSSSCPPCPTCPVTQPCAPCPAFPSRPRPRGNWANLTLECLQGGVCPPKAISAYSVSPAFSSCDRRLSCTEKLPDDEMRTAVMPIDYNPNSNTPNSNNSNNLNNSNRLVVHFYSLPNCFQCKQFRPEWEKLRRYFVVDRPHTPIICHEVDASKHDGLLQAQRHGVQAFPTVTYSREGPLQQQMHLSNGYQKAEELIARVQRLL